MTNHKLLPSWADGLKASTSTTPVSVRTKDAIRNRSMSRMERAAADTQRDSELIQSARLAMIANGLADRHEIKRWEKDAEFVAYRKKRKDAPVIKL